MLLHLKFYENAHERGLKYISDKLQYNDSQLRPVRLTC